MSQRSQVLSLCRKTIRIARDWKVPSEKQYIMDEMRRLVTQNKHLSSFQSINEKIHEFETRIITGVHYQIPYPRPVNVIPGATGKDPKVVTPVYLHSYKNATKYRVNPNTMPVYED